MRPLLLATVVLAVLTACAMPTTTEDCATKIKAAQGVVAACSSPACAIAADLALGQLERHCAGLPGIPEFQPQPEPAGSEE